MSNEVRFYTVSLFNRRANIFQLVPFSLFHRRLAINFSRLSGEFFHTMALTLELLRSLARAIHREVSDASANIAPAVVAFKHF